MTASVVSICPRCRGGLAKENEPHNAHGMPCREKTRCHEVVWIGASGKILSHKAWNGYKADKCPATGHRA